MGRATSPLNDPVAGRIFLKKQIIYHGRAVDESVIRVPTTDIDIDPV